MTDKITQARKVLNDQFGYDQFRPNQEAVISHVLAGKDTFVLMPTGGGKSLCYQIPALVFPGLTIVISPLIALMKDQVDALRLNGVAAAYLNSSLAYQEQDEIYRSMLDGKLKLLYLAPERLLNSEREFIQLLKPLKISLIAIDEAHCISQWGHDFRPEYLMLSRLKQVFPETPVIALTATADRQTRQDILDKLALRAPGVFVSSFNRPNIRYRVEPKQQGFARLLEFLKTRKQESGIIYCLSRVSTEKLAEDLQREGYKVLPYHAGLDRDKRAKHQDLFLKDEVRLITATIAFGMGIDKSNVRFVVHMDLPKSIEGFYQETGRAGRDGLDSETLLLYTYADVVKMKKLAPVENNDAQTRINLAKLDKMAAYGNARICRRKFLLEYFDEPAPDYCGNCDICLGRSDGFDGTVIAQKALSAVARLQERYGVSFVVDFLRGEPSEKIRDEHRQLKTFGVGADISRVLWIKYILELIALGYLRKTEGEYPLLNLTEKSMAVLKGQQRVMLTRHASSPAPTYNPDVVAMPEYEVDLYEILKVTRRSLAEEAQVPAYLVLSDASLVELATYLPQSQDALYQISGFGEVKVERYGEAFLEVIVPYCTSRGLHTRMHLKKGKPRRSTSTSTTPRMKSFDDDTKQQTLDLFRSGKDVFEISEIRKLKPATIESHLLHFIEQGVLSVREVVSPSRVDTIVAAAEKKGHVALSPIKELLGDDYSYSEIRMVVAYLRRRD